MKKYRRNILILIIVSFVDAFGGNLTESNTTVSKFNALSDTELRADTVEIDTTGVLPYDFEDEPAFAYPNKEDSAKLFLKTPSNIRTEIVYDPVTGEYIFTEKVGELNYRLPKTMTRTEFQKYDFEQSVRNYWRNQTQIKALEDKGGLIPRLTIGGETFNKIFGSNTIDIRPQGFVEVSFGYQMNATENPSIPERLRKVPTFDFDQKIQMNVTGKIGERMEMRVNYNTEATFDYENKMSLAYTGDEDQIVKKIEAGNVSLPLNGSLITGGSNLFGIKTELQFGKLNVTTIFSQHKGETQVMESEGGAQKKSFEIQASEYDANRHFFLSHYFRNSYNNALRNLPIIESSITINKIEVWVTNKSSNFKEARNILALMDLAENDTAYIYNNIPAFQEIPGLPYPESVYPHNEANGLFEQMKTTYSGIRQSDNINKTLGPLASSNFSGGQDFEKIEQARLLSESEYSINLNLGYISLRSALNTDEVLAVAYNYTADGVTYQVGEFSTDGIDAPQTLILKLLKGTNLSPKIKTWDLMMKNIYDLNAYTLTKDEFVLDIMYQNDKTGNYINYIPEGRLDGNILLNVLNLDKLNTQLDLGRDGVFDYVEGITVSSSTGKIIFPVLEPFGKNLADSLDAALVDKYAYFSLYNNTKTVAEQDAEHNKFILKGSYKGSSSSELMAPSQNLARGSVKVTTGGRTLVENVDYTVDYASGIVKIINAGLLESGSPIQVSTESQDLFSMQRKTLIGAHANYAISDRFNLGATVMHMQERPLTQKVNYGDDPISNTIFGLDASYNSESLLLTKLVDKLPFYSTKAPSSITFDGEIAQLVPGHSKVINSSGTVYIDDFEATRTSIDLKQRQAWALASTPQLQPLLFPEGEVNDSRSYGFNRAKLAWYEIDALFLRNSPNTPDYIKNDKEMQSNHLVREIYEKEIFPDRETPVGQPTNILTFDLAFYPSERGPYNFDTRLNTDGSLQNPDTRWGGIMRQIETSDFEAANIEFIEFWVMDPFVNDTLQTSDGGDLYFNLGDISEDILKDSRKSFENGLPTTAEVKNVDNTIWGRVPTQQSLTQLFDNDGTTRQYQDIGLDGLNSLNSEDEANFYEEYLQSLQGVVDPDILNNSFRKDPSADDFHYFRGSDYDEQELGILERYKNYNGPEGNSKTDEMSPESYITSASSIPDMEDINEDNTLNEYERYYQYKVSVRHEDMVLGQNYIADIKEREVKLDNGKVSTVKWYQFKVPVKNPNAGVYGSISDFKSIRFMRMFMKGFSQPTVLRFATFDLVRSEWRKYTKDVNGGVGVVSPETRFDVSAVNIEENASRRPVNYVLPPGIERVIDPANPQLRQLNEQSLMLRTIDLVPGDARAAYKNLSMDFRNYKRLQLEVHAEAIEDRPLNPNDLSLFIRVGTDYYNNYYEYEIPLTPTTPGFYNGENELHRMQVWPNENRVDLSLEAFTNLKLKRNDDMRQAGSTTSLTEEYIDIKEDNRILKIKGNPNLGNVEVMMVGIRNNYADTKDPKGLSTEVWINELRLSDFEEGGGWAATGRVTARLADLGTVIFAGRTRSAGFGSIEQKVNQRAMDDLVELDLSANLELGKFFPDKAMVKIPMYVGYSESRSNPKYNPLDPDIKMKDALNAADGKAQKDSIKKIAQDLVTRKSINFTNVKIDRSHKSGKPKLYDPTNFSVTYTYNEMMKRSINIEQNLDKNHRGMFSYNYNGRPEPIEPFKKSKVLSKPSLRLIKDFNFTLAPAQFSFRTDMWRHYNEIQLRSISNPNMIIPMTFNKDFIWNKYYDIHYNLTRSLQFDFSTQGTARIDEPEGRINRLDEYEWKRDSIWQNIKALGRPTLYHHMLSATYMTPINKLPLLDWTSLSATYRGMYDWQTGPRTSSDVELGNQIENSSQYALNGQLNMVSLYNKVGFLKEVNQKYGTSSRQQQRMQRPRPGQASQTKQPGDQPPADPAKIKEVQYTTDNVRLRANTPKSIFHKLKTKDVEVTAFGKDGAPVEGTVAIVNENRVTFTPDTSNTSVRFVVKGKIQKDGDLGIKIIQYTARALMAVRSISGTYTVTDGTVLPGFMPVPKVMGFGKYNPDPDMYGYDLPSSTAPGLPFLLGWQDDEFVSKAASKGWITRDSALNQPFVMSHSEAINFRANVEPFADLKIDVNANRTYSERTTQFYNYDVDEAKDEFLNKTVRGNFSMSINTMRTAFSKMGNDGNAPASKAFQALKDNRIKIAERLANNRLAGASQGYNRGEGEFPEGYGPTSSQVLIPAFIAAYTGQSPDKVSLEPFPKLKYLRPNWRITYEGAVAQSDFLKRYFKTLSFSHAYRSSYNVGSFITNLDYIENQEDGFSYQRRKISDVLEGDFIGEYDINTVSISEQFSPLINMEITFLNDFETRAELKTSRNLALSFSNNQITEVLSNEMVFGLGYRFTKMDLIIKTKKSQKAYSNDLNIRGDLSFRKNKTILRKIVEDDEQLTAGQGSITLKTTADYMLSDRFQLRFYFDKILNNPYKGSFKTSNTNVGVSFRFTLAQ